MSLAGKALPTEQSVHDRLLASRVLPSQAKANDSARSCAAVSGPRQASAMLAASRALQPQPAAGSPAMSATASHRLLCSKSRSSTQKSIPGEARITTVRIGPMMMTRAYWPLWQRLPRLVEEHGPTTSACT